MQTSHLCRGSDVCFSWPANMRRRAACRLSGFPVCVGSPGLPMAYSGCPKVSQTFALHYLIGSKPVVRSPGMGSGFSSRLLSQANAPAFRTMRQERSEKASLMQLDVNAGGNSGNSRTGSSSLVLDVWFLIYIYFLGLFFSFGESRKCPVDNCKPYHAATPLVALFSFMIHEPG